MKLGAKTKLATSIDVRFCAFFNVTSAPAPMRIAAAGKLRLNKLQIKGVAPWMLVMKKIKSLPWCRWRHFAKLATSSRWSRHFRHCNVIGSLSLMSAPASSSGMISSGSPSPKTETCKPLRKSSRGTTNKVWRPWRLPHVQIGGTGLCPKRSKRWGLHPAFIKLRSPSELLPTPARCTTVHPRLSLKFTSAPCAMSKRKATLLLNWAQIISKDIPL